MNGSLKVLILLLAMTPLAGCQTTQHYVPTEKNKNPTTWEEKYAHCHRAPTGPANFIPGFNQMGTLVETAQNTKHPECLVRGWDASFFLAGLNQNKKPAEDDKGKPDTARKTR